MLERNKMYGSKEWIKYKKLIAERPELFKNSGPIDIVLDEEIVESYEQKTGKTIGVCYESEYNILVVDLVCEKQGQYFAYERLLPTVEKGAVVCVPKYTDKYILLKQYRHALRDYQYAFPRGYGELGLSPEENAQKEMREEMNACVETVSFLGNIVADSGLLGNKVDIYLCAISSYSQPESYEGITELIEVSEDELEQMIKENKISDGFTLSAYAYLR